ncbi:MAG: ATP-binding cassette domain-containing protein [Phycisphaerales bacterium]|nr:ATP-binding cassette domain-containing protein [Phycisphaerales bacterium]
MLTLDNISKRFGSVMALQPLSLEIQHGTTHALIGPSGCGKSTLLRLMVGLITPDTGQVMLDGAALTPATIRDIRLRMGYVIQEGGLFPHMTARGNVTFMARRLRWPGDRIDERVAELARLTHFPDAALSRYPAQLSGGQRQRVGLMRALMLDPQVLLLDEPLGALDPMIRASLQGELRDIFQSLNKTVVLVTHDLAEAAYFAEKIVLLRRGELRQIGTMRELIDAPASDFVREFVSAQRSLVETLEDAS